MLQVIFLSVFLLFKVSRGLLRNHPKGVEYRYFLGECVYVMEFSYPFSENT